MLQKITELWPGLVRYGGDDEDPGQPSQTDREEESDQDANHIVDEEQIIQDYHRLFWTRLMAIDGYEAGQERKWPLGPDIVEECQAVEQLPAVDEDEWAPLFEPAEFNVAQGPLTLDGYRLSSTEL